MKKFKPMIFTIVTKDGYCDSVWDLLTLDGETPYQNFYFKLKGDMPSSNEEKEIEEKIEKEDWEIKSIEETDLEIEDFYIDKNLVGTLGEEYSMILKELKKYPKCHEFFD